MKESLEPLIPTGHYCYSYTGRIMINNKVINSDGELVHANYYFIPETIVCPFWKSLGSEGAFCTHTGKTSKRGGTESLMWDQIKECGVNVPDENLDIFLAEEGHPMLHNSESHLKRKPQFIESLIGILSNSDNNEFSYDGVTYTLSKSILDALN